MKEIYVEDCYNGGITNESGLVSLYSNTSWHLVCRKNLYKVMACYRLDACHKFCYRRLCHHRQFHPPASCMCVWKHTCMFMFMHFCMHSSSSCCRHTVNTKHIYAHAPVFLVFIHACAAKNMNIHKVNVIQSILESQIIEHYMLKLLVASQDTT